MSVLIVTNSEYQIKQGKNAVITNNGTISISLQYNDATASTALVAGGTDPTYTIPFMKDAFFKVTAQTAETRFDYSPQT